MQNTADIILKYLTDRRISAAQLARDMGVTRQAVHYWLTGDIKNPDPLRLMRIAEHTEDDDLRQLANDLLEAMTGNNRNE